MLSQWEIDHYNRKRRRERLGLWSILLWIIGVGGAIYGGVQSEILLVTPCLLLIAVACIGIFLFVPPVYNLTYRRCVFPLGAIVLLGFFIWCSLDVPYAIRHE